MRSKLKELQIIQYSCRMNALFMATAAIEAGVGYNAQNEVPDANAQFALLLCRRLVLACRAGTAVLRSSRDGSSCSIRRICRHGYDWSEQRHHALSKQPQ